MKKFANDHRGNKLVLIISHNEFKLSWMEIFRKHKPELLKQLQSSKERLTIMDCRRKAQRKVWRLTDNFEDYINSFCKALRKYKTEIGKLKPNGHIAASVPQQSTSRAANSNATLTLNLDHSANGQRSNNAAHRAGRNQMRMEGREFLRPVIMDIDPDDSASMADSMLSQDSQVEDLLQLGVGIEEIKSCVCTRLSKQVDNNMMLLIQHELQQLIDAGDGRFMRATRHIPKTATMLNLIFNLKRR